MPNYQSESIDRLFVAISKLNSLEECRAFFDDLCTIKELQDMSQRFDAAILLSEGKNYLEITKAIGISTATISRVGRCLNYGSGGYKKAIESIKEANNADK